MTKNERITELERRIEALETDAKKTKFDLKKKLGDMHNATLIDGIAGVSAFFFLVWVINNLHPIRGLFG